MNEGWIALYRELLKSDVWREESPQVVLLYIYLLLKANHSPVPFGKIEIQRGQHLTSVPELVKALNSWYTYDQIDNALDKLKQRGLIAGGRSGSRKSLLTVCGYDKYQGRTEAEKRPNTKPNTELHETQAQQGFKGNEVNELAEQMAEQKPKKDLTKKNNDLKNNEINNNTYTIQERDLFSVFQNWIEVHAPNVAAMQQPFKIEHYLELKKRAGTRKFYSIVEDLQNWHGLKSDMSAYSIFLTFFKRQGGETSELPPGTAPKLPPEEERQAIIEGYATKKMVI